MRIKFLSSLLSILLIALTGCGTGWPPTVNTKDDIQRLPISERSIRARGVGDSDIPSLARLQELRVLDFTGGWVMPARITDKGLAELAELELPRLETLTLGWCDNITDAGLAHVGRMQTIVF